MTHPHWTKRDVKHWVKYRYLVRNLKRKRRSKLAHGSYHNRGEFARYVKTSFDKPFIKSLSKQYER